jgi:uncharacterized protein DUF1353
MPESRFYGLFAKGGPRGYYTNRELVWDVGKKGSGLQITIPKGRAFESSVPRPLWWVLSPDNPRYLLSACIHDYLLEEGYRPFFAAGEWYDAALASGAPSWRSYMAALTVATVTVFNRRK